MKTKNGELICLIWDYDSGVEYVRGNVSEQEAKQAYDRECGPRSSEGVVGIKHRWARWHPAGSWSEYTHVLHVQDEQARGTFAVTEVLLK